MTATRSEHFLVTGAAGCIGAWAVRLLLDGGVAVTASDFSPDLRRYRLISLGRDGAEPDFAPLDITRGEDVAAVVGERGISAPAAQPTPPCRCTSCSPRSASRAIPAA
jgi:nucleoside-diphosphate-sugar epimerase